MADHQRSTPAAELQFFCAGMNPPSLKDLLRGCLLVAFFENLQVLPWTLRDLRKPTSPPLPLREGPPLISVFSPQGRRGNRSSSSLVTISFLGWRTIRGLRQQRSCSSLCGDEPALLKSFWWERRDTNKYLLLWTRFHFSLKDLQRGCLLLWDSLDRWWKYFLFDFRQDRLWRGSHQGYGGNLVTTIGI